MNSSNQRFIVSLFLVFFMLSACGIFNKQPSNQIVSDGNTIHYEVFGGGNQTLLFIHGWSNTLHVWDEQVDAFSENYRVVALDLPGFGGSKNNRNSWTMDAFGADVVAVINHLQLDDVILVGFSMGGPVSIETAKLAPNKIKGIVLVDILHNPGVKNSNEYMKSLTNSYMDTVKNPTLENVRPFFRTKQRELSEKFIVMVRDASKIGWEESLHNCLIWINNASVESIKRLEIPILAINADQRRTDTEAFRKYNPMFKARIIEGVNHVVFWESPERFNQYLEDSIQDIQNSTKQSRR